MKMRYIIIAGIIAAFVAGFYKASRINDHVEYLKAKHRNVWVCTGVAIRERDGRRVACFQDADYDYKTDTGIWYSCVEDCVTGDITSTFRYYDDLITVIPDKTFKRSRPTSLNSSGE